MKILKSTLSKEQWNNNTLGSFKWTTKDFISLFAESKKTILHLDCVCAYIYIYQVKKKQIYSHTVKRYGIKILNTIECELPSQILRRTNMPKLANENKWKTKELLYSVENNIFKIVFFLLLFSSVPYACLTTRI